MKPRARDYTNARSNAKRRGIRWALSFASWAAIWEASGKYALRGRKKGQYQMDRQDPSKGYTKSNVQIVPGSVNRVKDSPHGHMAKLTEQQVLWIRAWYRPRITTMKMLAVEFSVTPACVKAVLRRQNWKGV